MRMQHVTIMSNSLDESVVFYQDVVGLSIVRDLRDQPEHKIVFLSDKEGETCVELVCNPDGAFAGSGISIGFSVENAADYREKLLKDGYEAGEMISPNPKARFFFVKDPNGVDIQFVED